MTSTVRASGSRRMAVLASVVAAIGLMVPVTMRAQDAPRIELDLVPTETGGQEGAAILTANEDGTSVQVFALGAEEGTTAVIHAGTCDAIGEELIGFIGQLLPTGVTTALVPIPLGTLADGAHVVTLHAGMEFSVPLACGLIPETPILGPAPSATPAVTAPPTPAPTPTAPPVDTACLGITEWAAVAKAQLDRYDELEAELGRQSANFNAYMATLAATLGELGVMVEELRFMTVPSAAAEAHATLVDGLEVTLEGGQLLSEAFLSGDMGLYQQSTNVLKDAQEKRLKARTQIGELEGRCPAPAA
jgi:hypothetical protein